jgi:citrate synthase
MVGSTVLATSIWLMVSAALWGPLHGGANQADVKF